MSEEPATYTTGRAIAEAVGINIQPTLYVWFPGSKRYHKYIPEEWFKTRCHLTWSSNPALAIISSVQPKGLTPCRSCWEHSENIENGADLDG